VGFTISWLFYHAVLTTEFSYTRMSGDVDARRTETDRWGSGRGLFWMDYIDIL